MSKIPWVSWIFLHRAWWRIIYFRRSFYWEKEILFFKLRRTNIFSFYLANKMIKSPGEKIIKIQFFSELKQSFNANWTFYFSNGVNRELSYCYSFTINFWYKISQNLKLSVKHSLLRREMINKKNFSRKKNKRNSFGLNGE